MGAYYLLDTQKNSFEKIADISPWLKPEYMAKVENIRFKSRDSLLINGYLTLPPGIEPKNLPVVVYIHGGPWTRVKWGFDYVSQFLANRGYAVLNVNYRGSTGYGKKFFQAGFKEWGGKMLDDVNDGTKWLLEQKIADPNRIAVFGFSFGGYSSLMALAKNPELYSCGIDYSGIISVESLFESIPSYYTPFLEMMYEMIGNPKTEFEMLKKISPLYLTDKINKPVMIIHGKRDNRVKYDDVVKFVSKLKKNGTEVEFIVKDDEGHSFMNEENRIELFRKIESFLAKHLAHSEFN
ncbi:MAG: S9 family peptidase [Ignavibacteria bacterium]|nr:MAG: S9 family peptidase [Ignavibacteria bacterium]